METLFLDAIHAMTSDELRAALRRKSTRHDTLSVVHRNAIKSELQKRAQQQRAQLHAIEDALDEHVQQLDKLAANAYGAQLSIWYSGNDGNWKWSYDAIPEAR